MKALSVLQPWASAIMAGKNIENRTWPTRGYTGPLLIHASKGYDRDGADQFIAQRGITLPPDLPRGAILGIVTLKGGHGSHACVRTGWDARLHQDDPYSCSPWAVGGDGGMCHWELADPRPLTEPVPCRGALGLWTPPDEVLVAVIERLRLVEPCTYCLTPAVGLYQGRWLCEDRHRGAEYLDNLTPAERRADEVAIARYVDETREWA